MRRRVTFSALAVFVDAEHDSTADCVWWSLMSLLYIGKCVFQLRDCENVSFVSCDIRFSARYRLVLSVYLGTCATETAWKNSKSSCFINLPERMFTETTYRWTGKLKQLFGDIITSREAGERLFWQAFSSWRDEFCKICLQQCADLM